MWVEAILSKENVVALVGDFLPLSIHLGENPDDGHYLELFEPRDVSLVESQGLRMSCRARVRWPILGIDLPVTVESVTLLLCPSIPEPSQDELIFKLTIEAIDLAWAPSVIDDRITEKINDELAKKHALLSWRFGETLSHVFQMPQFLPPLEAVALDVAWGQVRVASDAMVIAISFHSRVLRDKSETTKLAGPRPTRDLPTTRPSALAAPSTGVTPLVAAAGGAALATLAAWAIVAVGTRAWRFAAGRA
jgi:hypothetical protein